MNDYPGQTSVIVTQETNAKKQLDIWPESDIIVRYWAEIVLRWTDGAYDADDWYEAMNILMAERGPA